MIAVALSIVVLLAVGLALLQANRDRANRRLASQSGAPQTAMHSWGAWVQVRPGDPQYGALSWVTVIEANAASAGTTAIVSATVEACGELAGNLNEILKVPMLFRYNQGGLGPKPDVSALGSASRSTDCFRYLVTQRGASGNVPKGIDLFMSNSVIQEWPT